MVVGYWCIGNAQSRLANAYLLPSKGTDVAVKRRAKKWEDLDQL